MECLLYIVLLCIAVLITVSALFKDDEACKPAKQPEPFDFKA